MKKRFLPLISYCFLTLAAYLAGYRMTILQNDWHLLDYSWLRDGFLESIWNLHSQPPLLNVLLGLSLKMQALTGIKPEYPLFIVNFILGGLSVFFLAELAKALIKNRYLYFAVMALILLNPMLYDYVFIFFYTIHVLFYLSLMAWLIYKYSKERRLKYYGGICIAAVAMVYTRSLFHFVWAFFILLALPVLLPPLKKRETVLRFAYCALLSSVLLLAWPLKNYEKFDFFGYSSWQGYNLARGLNVRKPLLYYIFFSQGVDPAYAPLEEAYTTSMVIPEYQNVPCLAKLCKKGYYLNWNHYSIISLFRLLERESISFLLENPRAVLQKAYYCYCNGYTIYEGRDPYTGILHGSFAKDAPMPAQIWMKAYEALAFQCFKTDPGYDLKTGTTSGGPKTGFAFFFPVILLAAVGMSFYAYKKEPAETAAAIFMLYNVLWVLAMVLLIDGFEGNRMRFATQPFLFILTGWVLSNLFKPRTHNLATGKGTASSPTVK
jgi:hypothetical protein